LTDIIFDKIRYIASDVFSVPVDIINANSSPDTIEAWDSMTHLNLVLALEDEFRLHFSPEEIASMRDIATIVTLIKSKA
jgi:acyl carrier protein